MATSFGRDVSCMTEMKSGRFVTGLRLVAEACFRRLTTPRGRLRGGEDEANYGLNLTEFVGSSLDTNSTAAMLPGRIRAELQKDARIEDVEVNIVVSTSGALTSYLITITVTTAEGPFDLTLNASAVTVELIGIEEGA